MNPSASLRADTDEHRYKRRTWCLVLCAWCLVLAAAAQEPPKPTPEQEEQHARAREILEEARKVVFALPKERGAVRAWLLQGIADAYADAGDVDAALLALDAMGNTTPDVKESALSLVAVAQARSGDVAGALRTLASVESENRRSLAQYSVVLRLAQEGYWGPARQFADQIEGDTARGVALGDLARAQAVAGDSSAARSTAGAIPDKEYRERIVQNLGELEAKAASGKQVKLLDLGFSIVPLGKRASPEDISFGVLFRSIGLAVVGDKSNDPAVNEVRDRVRAVVKAKDQQAKEEALGSLQEAAQLASGIAEPSERADHLYLVAIGQAELGDSNAARETARALTGQKGGAYLRGYIHLYSLRHISSIQAASGDVGGALASAEGEEKLSLRAVSLLGAAEGVLRRLEVERWPKDFPNGVILP